MEKKEGLFPGNERYKHESFGLLQFSRVTGTSKFFGSEATHNNYISLRLSSAVKERDNAQDWYFPEKVLSEIKLTEMQFASLITTLNSGSGVPVTITYFNKKIEDLPELENRKEYLLRKIRDLINKTQKNLNPKNEILNEILEKKSLTNKDRQELKNLISSSQDILEDSLPFYLKCFEESLHELVVEAEIEVEAKINNKIHNLGKQVLKEQIQKSQSEIKELIKENYDK